MVRIVNFITCVSYQLNRTALLSHTYFWASMHPWHRDVLPSSLEILQLAAGVEVASSEISTVLVDLFLSVTVFERSCYVCTAHIHLW
jgi:hypothetical protein